MATNNYFTKLVGKGITFPIQITKDINGKTGVYPVNGDFELVRNNISSILYYLIGQRFRQEEFGNRLWECIEEQNTQALSYLIKSFIRGAIEAWEQRVKLKSITVTRNGAKVDVQVNYRVVGSESNQYLYLTYDSMDNSLNSY